MNPHYNGMTKTQAIGIYRYWLKPHQWVEVQSGIVWCVPVGFRCEGVVKIDGVLKIG